MNDEDKYALLELRIFSSVRDKVVSWIRIYGLILGFLAVLVSIFGVSAWIDQSVDSAIRKRSEFIERAFSEVSSALTAETTSQIADGKVRIAELKSNLKELESQILVAEEFKSILAAAISEFEVLSESSRESSREAIERVDDGILKIDGKLADAGRRINTLNSSIDLLRTLVKKTEELSEDQNLANLILILEKSFYSIGNFTARIAVCFENEEIRDAYKGQSILQELAPELIFESELDVDKTISQGGKLANIQFRNVGSRTALWLGDRPCFERESHLYIPFKRALIGKDIREIPPFSGVNIRTPRLPALFSDTGGKVSDVILEYKNSLHSIVASIQFNGISVLAIDAPFSESVIKEDKNEDGIVYEYGYSMLEIDLFKAFSKQINKRLTHPSSTPK